VPTISTFCSMNFQMFGRNMSYSMDAADRNTLWPILADARRTMKGRRDRSGREVEAANPLAASWRIAGESRRLSMRADVIVLLARHAQPGRQQLLVAHVVDRRDDWARRSMVLERHEGSRHA